MRFSILIILYSKSSQFNTVTFELHDMDFMFKYPRTRHIEGSKKQVGDEDLDYISFKEIKGFYVVLEEKVDGANSDDSKK